jgi:hypothetical protein
MGAHTLSFIAFERAGVGFFLGYANFRQSVENRPALYFQFAR